MVSTGKMLAFINALGGGSGPSEVVILPETVVTVTEGQGYITTPLSATPTGGATAKVTYNGTEYACTIVRADDETGVSFAMGNIDVVDMPFGGNPDAPFVVALIPDGMGDTGDGTIVYGVVMPLDGATSVTLSIVQIGAASGGESAGGGTYDLIVDAATNTTEQKWGALVEAANAGKCVQMVLRATSESGTLAVIGWLMAIATVNGAISTIYFYIPGLMIDKSARYAAMPGENGSIEITVVSVD